MERELRQTTGAGEEKKNYEKTSAQRPQSNDSPI